MKKLLLLILIPVGLYSQQSGRASRFRVDTLSVSNHTHINVLDTLKLSIQLDTAYSKAKVKSVTSVGTGLQISPTVGDVGVRLDKPNIDTAKYGKIGTMSIKDSNYVGFTYKNNTWWFSQGIGIAPTHLLDVYQNSAITNSVTQAQVYIKNALNTASGHASVTIDKGNSGAGAEFNLASGGVAQWTQGISDDNNFHIRDAVNSFAKVFNLEQGVGVNAIYGKSGGNIGFGTASPDSGVTSIRGGHLRALKLDGTLSVGTTLNGMTPRNGLSLDTVEFATKFLKNADSTSERTYSNLIYRLKSDSAGSLSGLGSLAYGDSTLWNNKYNLRIPWSDTTSHVVSRYSAITWPQVQTFNNGIKSDTVSSLTGTHVTFPDSTVFSKQARFNDKISSDTLAANGTRTTAKDTLNLLKDPIVKSGGFLDSLRHAYLDKANTFVRAQTIDSARVKSLTISQRDSIRAFGDSFTTGYGLTNPDSGGYVGIVSQKTGWNIKNYGYPGGQVMDYARNYVYSSPIDTGDISTFLIGFNDMRFYGLNDTGVSSYQSCARAALTWAALGRSDRISFFPTTGLVTTGSWSHIQGYGSYGPYSIYTASDSATISMTLVGTAIYIGYTQRLGFGANYGRFKITIDGKNYGIISERFGKKPNTNLTYWPELVRIGGLSNGPHKVIIMALTDGGTNTVQLEWYGTNKNARWTAYPLVYMGSTCRMDSAGYAGVSPWNKGSDSVVSVYNKINRELVYELASDGLNITTVEAGVAFNPNDATQVQGDNVHPSLAGHYRIAMAFLSSIDGYARPLVKENIAGPISNPDFVASTSISKLNFFGPQSSSGYYQVSGTLELTTASSTDTITVNISYNNDNGAQTISLIKNYSPGTTSQAYFDDFPIKCLQGGVAWSTAVVGSPTYRISLSCKRVY